MKILHCCLAAFYIDDYGYQENILPKMHKLQGLDVKIIASTETYINNAKLGYVSPSTYKTKEDIPITRLPYVKYLPHKISKKLRIYNGLKRELYSFKPDIIFLHDCQFLSITEIAKYKKKYPKTKIYVDSHTDFINSAKSWVSKNILHKIKEESPPDVLDLPMQTSSRLSGSKTRISTVPGLLSSSPAKLGSPSSSNDNQLQSQQQQMRNKQRNYKNMTRERRIEANARERTRVHTISSAYEKLRQSIPSYSHNQKLSKLSILRIAASYINTLSKLADDTPESEQAACVEDTTRTIQFEGRAKKKRED